MLICTPGAVRGTLDSVSCTITRWEGSEEDLHVNERIGDLHTQYVPLVCIKHGADLYQRLPIVPGLASAI